MTPGELLREAGFVDLRFERVGRVPALAKSMLWVVRTTPAGMRSKARMAHCADIGLYRSIESRNGPVAAALSAVHRAAVDARGAST